MNQESVIPLKIYTTWHTKNLPEKMKENFEKLKSDNPEFEVLLYDENDCIEFLKNNYPTEFVDAYNALIPNSYKSDLWRFCILYANGGIYIDIKFNCVNNFKFINLTDKEYFCSDPPYWKEGKKCQSVTTGLIFVKKNNSIILKALMNILININKRDYCINPWATTGPCLLGYNFTENDGHKKYPFILNHENYIVHKNNEKILELYTDYIKEREASMPYYVHLWKQKKIYNLDITIDINKILKEKKWPEYLYNSLKDYISKDNLYKIEDDIITELKNKLNSIISDEEKYLICLRLYKELHKNNKEIDGIYYLIESNKYDNKRIECIYRLITYYNVMGSPKIAYSFYLLIQDYYENEFINDIQNISNKKDFNLNEYIFYLPYFMIIISIKLQKWNIAIKMFEIIFKFKYTKSEEWYINNLIYNLYFILEHVNNNNNNNSNFYKECEIYLNLLDTIHNLNISNIYRLTDVGLNINNLNMLQNQTNINNYIEECNKSNKILIYTGFCDKKWNYSYSQNSALGGSERAVINVAKYLQKDYDIYIGGDVEEEIYKNIRFIKEENLSKLLKENYFKTIIISRFINFFELYPFFKTKNVFIWGHDTNLLTRSPNPQKAFNILNKWNSKINNYICLTEWQKQRYENIYPMIKNKIELINNGINLELFPKNINKKKNRFVFTSGPARGLGRVLELWPEICNKLEDAELKFATYTNFPCTEEDNKMQEIISKYNNIQFMGRLNPNELYELQASSEYWLYPTNFDETSCITALEMLYNEVICVYYPRAGLTDTVGEYGIKVSNENEIASIINLTEEDKIKLRASGKKYAEECSWENRANIWLNLIKYI